ncbi:MFS transporter, partial [Bacillus paralicheniformis]|nr:MFS transporter [Bacillus paralicheniformis]
VPVTVAYVGDRLEPQDRQRALANLLSVSAIGFASGTLIAGVLAELVNWRAPLLVNAVSTLVLAFVYGRLPETHPPEATRISPLQRVGEVFNRGWMVFLLVFSFVEG